MVWIRIILVVLVLTRAIYTDVKRGIIENQCTLSGLLAGVMWSTLYGGVAGFIDSVKMIVIMLVALFVLYVIKGIGAGDVKLFCVLAAFYPEDVVGIVVVAFVVAAGLVLGRMLIRKIRRVPVYRRGETLCFSIPIGIATAIVVTGFRVGTFL